MIKDIRVMSQFYNPKYKRTEYSVTFTAWISDCNLHRDAIYHECDKVLSLLMVDPRRATAWPVFGGTHGHDSLEETK